MAKVKGAFRERHKLRILQKETTKSTAVYGITIPPYIGERFINTLFEIRRERDTIILQSGAKPAGWK